MNFSYLFLGGDNIVLYPLACALAKVCPSIAISLRATYKFSRKVSWPYLDHGVPIEKRIWSYPPGFNSKFNFIFNFAIRARLNQAISELSQQSGKPVIVVISDVSLLKYVEHIASDRLIYLNYDENPYEFRPLNRAGLVLCSSIFQTRKFQHFFPLKKSNIVHFPHGVYEKAINPQCSPSQLEKAVCIAGYLSSRYNWHLIYELVLRLPYVDFFFVGQIQEGARQGEYVDWHVIMQRVLKLPNVNHVNSLKNFNNETRHFYWRSFASWIPYDVNLSFNQACCPIKLFDGLASGHPIISADVPECRLYPDWIDVYKNADEAFTLISRILSKVNTPEQEQRQRRQIAFAQNNTWEKRAETLMEIIDRWQSACMS